MSRLQIPLVESPDEKKYYCIWGPGAGLLALQMGGGPQIRESDW